MGRKSLLLCTILFLTGCGVEATIPLANPFGKPPEGGPAYFPDPNPDDGIVEIAPANGMSLSFIGTPKEVGAGEFIVPVNPEMIVTIDGVPHELFATGYGVREKTVFIVTVDVYFAVSYMAKPVTSIKTNPLNKIAQSPVEVVILTMLRDVSGADMEDSFREALALNGVNTAPPEYELLFDELGRGSALAGEQMLLLSSKHTDSNIEDLLILRTKSKLETSGTNLGLNIWKAWFGVPVDGGMADLKNSLIQGS